MKKGLKNLAIATMVGVASMGFMTGCIKQPEDPTPYIKIAGLDTAYMQNQSINLDGAKILYYSDKNDTTADEVELQESMIANFKTDTTGQKKMRVLWNNFEVEVQYTVFSEEDIANLYNTARSNLINATHAHAEISISNGTRVIYSHLANVANNKFYMSCRENGTMSLESWVQKEGNTWNRYDVNYGNSVNTKRAEDYNGSVVMDIVLDDFLETKDELNSEAMADIAADIDFEGNKIILSLKILLEENLVQNYTIEDGRIVSLDFVECDAGGVLRSRTTGIISYNLADVEMVGLPEVDWT